jgi:hypothetical protein
MCFCPFTIGIVLPNGVIARGMGGKHGRAWKWKVVTRREARQPQSSEGRQVQGVFLIVRRGFGKSMGLGGATA